MRVNDWKFVISSMSWKAASSKSGREFKWLTCDSALGNSTYNLYLPGKIILPLHNLQVTIPKDSPWLFVGRDIFFKSDFDVFVDGCQLLQSHSQPGLSLLGGMATRIWRKDLYSLNWKRDGNTCWGWSYLQPSCFKSSAQAHMEGGSLCEIQSRVGVRATLDP